MSVFCVVFEMVVKLNELAAHSELRASRTIIIKAYLGHENVGEGCLLIAGSGIECADVGRESVLISHTQGIKAGKIADGCKLTAKTSIQVAEFGKECLLRADEGIFQGPFKILTKVLDGRSSSSQQAGVRKSSLRHGFLTTEPLATNDEPVTEQQNPFNP